MDSRPRVLIIDDEEDWRETNLKAPLSTLEYRVDTYSDRVSALQVVQREAFDLAVLNIRLSLAIKENEIISQWSVLLDLITHKAEAIIVTSRAFPPSIFFDKLQRMAFVDYGVCDVLTKEDFNSAEYVASVKRAIEKRRTGKPAGVAGPAKPATGGVAVTGSDVSVGGDMVGGDKIQVVNVVVTADQGSAASAVNKLLAENKTLPAGEIELALPLTPSVTFSWLHLSDWHIGRKDKTLGWEDLKEALLKDLREHQAPADKQPGHLAGVAFRPNAIFITGDIAYRAAESEYREAEKLLESIWEITQLGREQTFSVPGNHDVDRQAVTEHLYELAYKELAAPDLTEEQWLSALNELWRSPMLGQWRDAKFKPYRQFMERCTAAPAAQLYYVRYLPAGDQKVGILGVNSAVMSWRDGEDRERGLWIGKPQLKELEKSLQPDAAVHIALVHHPREALHECDGAWERLKEISLILLHGHMHRPRAILMQEAGRENICLPGGSIYEGTLWRSQRYTYGQFDLGTRELNLYLRMTKPGAEPLYIRDNQTYPEAGPEGHIRLNLRLPAPRP